MLSIELRSAQMNTERLSDSIITLLILLSVVLFVSCTEKVTSKDSNFPDTVGSSRVVGDFLVRDNEEENTIELLTGKGTAIHQFNYIPAYFESFSGKLKAGESYVLGKLPKLDKELRIIAWSDEQHPFELFIATNQSYHFVAEDIGANLLLIGDFEGFPWVYCKSNQQLWRISMEGKIVERRLIPIEDFGGNNPL